MGVRRAPAVRSRQLPLHPLSDRSRDCCTGAMQRPILVLADLDGYRVAVRAHVGGHRVLLLGDVAVHRVLLSRDGQCNYVVLSTVVGVLERDRQVRRLSPSAWVAGNYNYWCRRLCTFLTLSVRWFLLTGACGRASNPC